MICSMIIQIIATIFNIGVAILLVRLAIESYKECKESKRKLKEVENLEELISKINEELYK